MLELTLQRSGKRLMRQPIGSAPITIGRDDDNTLRLLDPEISRHHCRIEWREGALCATDLSTNGMLVNGELLCDAPIDAGDRLSIGPWTLIVEATMDAVPVKTLASTPHATRVLSYDPASRRLATDRVEIVVNSPDQAPTQKRIGRSEITIGHHGSCDVAVADPYVSRRHCRLVVSGDSMKLVDLGSTNGIYVGGVKVEQATLPAHGQFTIGRSTVSFRRVRDEEELSPSRAGELGRLVGTSRAMREIFALIERAAPSDATCLITGESGTGKEIAAREIHRLSDRCKGPFVAVNCGALPATIVEGQLFGHERGAFTGAVERAAGLFEQAKNGTLFLDEIGEMPLELQSRLLRVLESKSVRRLGAAQEVPVDFRLICATNRDLPRMVREGRFREDLLYRIHVVPIEMPPLRERREDIPLLAARIVSELAATGRDPMLTDGAMDALSSRRWPGNARELRNSLERTLVLCPHDVIEAADLTLSDLCISQDPRSSLRGREKKCLIEALRKCEGNITRAAENLGIARTTMQDKIRKYRIEIRKTQGSEINEP
jgi:DNA-binding NtrC family response regulator